jgi:hypothetical protein
MPDPAIGDKLGDEERTKQFVANEGPRAVALLNIEQLAFKHLLGDRYCLKRRQ